MKNLVLIILMSCFIIPLNADIIVKKDGTQMSVYNVEESGKWILYTTDESPDSELKRIDINEVFGIKQGEGEMKMVGTSNNVLPESKKDISGNPVKIAALPAAENADIINQYNTSSFSKIRKEPNPKKYREGTVTTIWGIAKNSILKDNHIRISINEKGIRKFSNKLFCMTPGYAVTIENHSDEMVYVDLSNSFKILDGESTPFYDGKIYTTSQGSSRGASVGLGSVANALGVGGAVGTIANGVSVGGGNSKSLQVSESAQPVISIPPHGTTILPLEKKIEGKEVYEVPDIYSGGELKESSVEMGLYDFGVVDIDDESIRHRYLITYSTDPNFSTYVQLPIELFLRGVLGNTYWAKSGQPNFEVGDNLIVGFGYVQKDKKIKQQEAKIGDINLSKDKRRKLKEELKKN